MSRRTKQPWMKFYPADWRADPALKVTSLAARGLWIEMLSLMHDADPRGSLLVKGKIVTSPMLAALVGYDEVTVSGLLRELEENGVYSRKKNGVIYSRRMELDENKARKNRENGKMGGNPSLCSETEKGESVNPRDKAKKPEARYQIPERGLPDGSLSPADDAFAEFCDVAGKAGFSVPKLLTKDRRQKVNARLSEHGKDGWSEACRKMAGSRFCRGENDRGWKADFEFLLQPKSFNGLIEGKYDDLKPAARPPPQKPKTPFQEHQEACREAMRKPKIGEFDEPQFASNHDAIDLDARDWRSH